MGLFDFFKKDKAASSFYYGNRVVAKFFLHFKQEKNPTFYN